MNLELWKLKTKIEPNKVSRGGAQQFLEWGNEN